MQSVTMVNVKPCASRHRQKQRRTLAGVGVPLVGCDVEQPQLVQQLEITKSVRPCDLLANTRIIVVSNLDTRFSRGSCATHVCTVHVWHESRTAYPVPHENAGARGGVPHMRLARAAVGVRMSTVQHVWPCAAIRWKIKTHVLDALPYCGAKIIIIK